MNEASVIRTQTACIHTGLFILTLSFFLYSSAAALCFSLCSNYPALSHGSSKSSYNPDATKTRRKVPQRASKEKLVLSCPFC